MKTIGQIAREIIVANKTASNKEILALVQAQLKAEGRESKTTVACIAWYKNDMKGDVAKQQAAQPAAEAAERTSETVELEMLELAAKLEELKQELEEMRKDEEMADREMLAQLAKKLNVQIG